MAAVGGGACGGSGAAVSRAATDAGQKAAAADDRDAGLLQLANLGPDVFGGALKSTFKLFLFRGQKSGFFKLVSLADF